MVAAILSKQNTDGGWPYVRGKSWTEPTAYAVMALSGAGEQAAALRGLKWMAAAQRADGGLPPQPDIDQSTWVTALAALLPPQTSVANLHERAVRWLTATSGAETRTLYRFRQRLLGNPPPPDQEFPGWPWVPGSAAWVGPTALTILALDKEWQRTRDTAVRARLDEGRRFLMLRICEGGGWNHGSARPLGYDSHAYPETTGMALAALRGTPVEKLGQSIELALRFLSGSRAADEIHWLRLGLLAHGRLPAGFRVPESVTPRTLSDTTLGMLVDDTEMGRGVFW